MKGRVLALVLLATGVLGIGVGLLLSPREALAACVASLLGLAGIPLGALVLGLALAPVSGSVRDQLWPWTLVGARALPALPLLVLPGLLGAGWLYEWAQQHDSGFRGFWLWWPSFAIRGLLYTGLWWALGRWVLPRSINQPAAAGLGLIALVLSVSLAAIDWALSLEPLFASSIFGLIWLGRLLLTGIAFCCLLALAAGAPRPGVLRGLLAAAVLAWMYLHFMQYLIVWYGNLPEEVRWYDARNGDWLPLTWLLALQGLVFIALWWPFSQRQLALALLSLVTLLLGLAEGVWLTLPSLSGLHSPALGLSLIAAWLAGGSVFALLLLPRRSA